MKIRWIFITIISLIIFYPTYFLPINRVVNGFYPINKTCSVDEDCKMGWADCPLCESTARGVAINIGYKPYCPLPKPFKMTCPNGTPQWYYGFNAVCVGGMCKEKATDEVDDYMNKWLYKLL